MALPRIPAASCRGSGLPSTGPSRAIRSLSPRPDSAQAFKYLNVPQSGNLKFIHILVVVGRCVPAGHAENSPVIHGWVDRGRSSRVPEGRLGDSVVPPGLGMYKGSLSQR